MALFAQIPGTQAALFAGASANDHPWGIKVLAESGGLKVVTPYNQQFVNELKTRIPATGRKWDPAGKCWMVAPKYGAELKSLIDQIYRCDVRIPAVLGVDDAVFEITFQADYIGSCKKVDGSTSGGVASVHANGHWSAKIPEAVLRKWFNQAEAQEAADEPQTLYAVLGVAETAKPEEIKKSFKRAARQWHPDICREPNAREMFEKVKQASDVLLNVQLKAKYDAGLFFEKLSKQAVSGLRGRQRSVSQFSSYTPVLRCGMLKVRARRELGLLIVEEILEWEDITNEYGQTMVSFWAGDSHSVMWV